MPSFDVIAATSETLRRRLENGLSNIQPNPPVVELHDLRTDPGEAQSRVTIFLFEIVEDPSTRNRPRQYLRNGSHVSVRKPPLTLLLRYLITPWSPARRTDQILLGRISQVFYDQPIISGADLSVAPLANSNESLLISMAPLTLEDRTRIWNTVQLKYRVSLNYEVRVVNVDATQSRDLVGVASRELGYGELVEDRS